MLKTLPTLKRSGMMVRSAGRVDTTLPDDTVGTPHQKFIVRLPNDHTVLVSVGQRRRDLVG